MSRYVTADEYIRIFGIQNCLDASTRIRIETLLNFAAGPIDAALNSVGAADCTISPAARATLQMINCIYAAVVWNCPCSEEWSDSDKQRYLEWAQSHVQAIGRGEIEVCEGATGTNYPAVAMPQIAWNDAIAAEIIYGYDQRTS